MANAKMICIGEVVGKYFNMDKKTMDSKTNKREISKVRQFAQHFAYEYKVASLSKIGAYFGGKNHSTVLHSYKTILNGIETDKMEKAAYESINKLIKARFKTDLSPNNKISELDMVKAVKRGLNDANSRIMFNLLLKEYSVNKFNMHSNIDYSFEDKHKITELKYRDIKDLPVLQIENDEVIAEFKNMHDVIKNTGIHLGNLCEALLGKRKTVNGYKFVCIK